MNLVDFIMNILKGYPTLMLWVPFMTFFIGVVVGKADEQHQEFEEAVKRILARRKNS